MRETLFALDAVLLDFRYKPVRRITGFGSRYLHVVAMLGGFGHITGEGIASLQPYNDLANCMLTCR